ncbi:Cytochrome c [Novipirellula galeiformis]|uniref:Cytochrome c n=1 Tax=Novipirellula galeiformis TaxID=2528004 RepID=A0A5C6CKN4_9BACT|nr:quinol:electron acceptor oxidoreductase subunit ActD [Novipirellula galeiformis]TWU23861.1 Cytochrome c [Novipirellula galeiformis]
MSDDKNEKKIHGMVAEFTSVDTLLPACRRVRDAGYTKTDAYAPFAVHGIDEALGIKPTVLPWLALGGGLAGTCTALAMQVWMNGIDYPYIISGKPYVLSLPAFIPVAFELTILFASFCTFFGMWALNGLPRFSNPIFTDPRFDRVTDDRFFLYIDSKDKNFDVKGVEKLLADTGSDYINTVVEDDTPTKIPKFLIIGLCILIGASIIPALIVAKMRVTNSDKPRFHIFPDMDYSPARDAQQTTTLFADNRAMRPDVPGTVARGQMPVDLDFLTGIDMETFSQLDSDRAERLVATKLTAIAAEGDAPAASEAPAKSVMDTTPWLDRNPLEITEAVVRQGQTQFNIYCSVCHGMDGRGNGLVNQRAQKIMATAWIPPSSVHQEALYSDQYPDGKLFNTISNGIRKMPGYSAQIKVQDRWAIVAYVRALQQSQNASIDLVPSSQLAKVERQKNKVDKQLKEAAEAERKKEEERAAKAAEK